LPCSKQLDRLVVYITFSRCNPKFDTKVGEKCRQVDKKPILKEIEDFSWDDKEP
jgi:hypothetical protein